MNQGNKNSGGHLEKHLGKLCVPCFVLLSLCTMQKVRWRQRLTVDGMQLSKRKMETWQRQVAVCGSGHKHAISCHWSPIRMYPNETWDSNGPFLNDYQRRWIQYQRSERLCCRWHGRETKRMELLAQDTLRKRTLEPVFGLVHWGPPGNDRVQTVDFGKFTVLILSDYVHKRELPFFNSAEKKI